MAYHLLFEGAELAGKSWLMAQIYDHLEPKYNQSREILDGCHWLNADIGVFGTPMGRAAIAGYLSIFRAIQAGNILVEKLHISDQVYNELYQGRVLDHADLEKELLALDFRIVLITFPEDEAVLAKRLEDRLRLYPHYRRISHEPAWYIHQQKLYRQKCAQSRLPVLEAKTDILPDSRPVAEILEWIGETPK